MLECQRPTVEALIGVASLSGQPIGRWMIRLGEAVTKAAPSLCERMHLDGTRAF